MTEDDSQALDVPVQLGDIDARDELPATSRTYLLLNTKRLEDWAYRPSPPEAGTASAIAPSVVELMRAVESFTPHRWLWSNGPLAYMEERGPLLADATDSPKLLEHAVTRWSPTEGVIIIGAEVDLDTLTRHLSSVSQITLPDQGPATFNFQSSLLGPWLSALRPGNRTAWLGPMRQLLWLMRWAQRVTWYQLTHPASAPASDAVGWLRLHPAELAAFNANAQEIFVAGLGEELRALPGYASLSLLESRTWIVQKINEAARVNIQSNADVRRYCLLRARHPDLLENPKAQALLDDPRESPVARLRRLSALAGENEFSDD